MSFICHPLPLAHFAAPGSLSTFRSRVAHARPTRNAPSASWHPCLRARCSARPPTPRWFHCMPSTALGTRSARTVLFRNAVTRHRSGPPVHLSRKVGPSIELGTNLLFLNLRPCNRWASRVLRVQGVSGSSFGHQLRHSQHSPPLPVPCRAGTGRFATRIQKWRVMKRMTPVLFLRRQCQHSIGRVRLDRGQ